jgi:metallo-beta-lactamase family protein
MTSIRFLGAAGTVTGSRFLVQAPGGSILVDAGLFQGTKELRLRNWQPFPHPVDDIDAVVLTHAHIDHIGALPLLVREGFRGPVYCTPGTYDLAHLLLPDSARLQEEEARFANKLGYSKHAPNARPLYDEEDALAAIRLLMPLRYGVRREIRPGIAITYHRAGHIIGSAMVQAEVKVESGRIHRMLFSGDLGRYDAPILPDPSAGVAADDLLIESTYGDRVHRGDPREDIKQAVFECIKRGGAMIIPAFAVGRTQEVLFQLRELEARKEIPELPIFVDSPMAIDATPMYLAHREDHDDEMTRLLAAGVEPLRPSKVIFARAPAQSKAINRINGPCIIISASGMATGGRILHHLANRLPDERTLVVLVGYQAVGTRGWRLQNGAETLRMHGEDVPVRAKVLSISGFSAHADSNEVERWLGTLPSPPKRVFCVHGDPEALAANAHRIKDRGWNVIVPSQGQVATIE